MDLIYIYGLSIAEITLYITYYIDCFYKLYSHAYTLYITRFHNYYYYTYTLFIA